MEISYEAVESDCMSLFILKMEIAVILLVCISMIIERLEMTILESTWQVSSDTVEAQSLIIINRIIPPVELC